MAAQFSRSCDAVCTVRRTAAGWVRDSFMHGQLRWQRIGVIDGRNLGSCAAQDGIGSVLGRSAGRRPSGRRRSHRRGGCPAPLAAARCWGVKTSGGTPPEVW